MKFSREKMNSLAGGTVVIRTEPTTGFQLVSTREGVKVDGTLEIASFDDLQAFAKVMAEAWTDHHSLVPKIVTSVSGH